MALIREFGFEQNIYTRKKSSNVVTRIDWLEHVLHIWTLPSTFEFPVSSRLNWFKWRTSCYVRSICVWRDDKQMLCPRLPHIFDRPLPICPMQMCSFGRWRVFSTNKMFTFVCHVLCQVLHFKTVKRFCERFAYDGLANDGSRRNWALVRARDLWEYLGCVRCTSVVYYILCVCHFVVADSHVKRKKALKLASNLCN